MLLLLPWTISVAGATKYICPINSPGICDFDSIEDALADLSENDFVLRAGAHEGVVFVERAVTLTAEPGAVVVGNPMYAGQPIFTVSDPYYGRGELTLVNVEIDCRSLQMGILATGGSVSIADGSLHSCVTLPYTDGTGTYTGTATSYTGTAYTGTYATTYTGGSGTTSPDPWASALNSIDATIDLTNVLFEDNEGAVAASGGNVTVTSATFTGNYSQGAALWAAAVEHLSVSDTVFEDNAGAMAGGVLVEGTVSAEVADSWLCGNDGGYTGGIMLRESCGEGCTVTRTVLQNNRSEGQSGALFLWNTATTELSHLTTQSNRGVGSSVLALIGAENTSLHNALFGDEIPLVDPQSPLEVDMLGLPVDPEQDWILSAPLPISDTIRRADPIFLDGQGRCGRDVHLQLDPPENRWLIENAIGAFPDGDEDGWLPPEDCDPWSPDIYPGVEDLPGDGLDADCDGVDGDGEDPDEPQPGFRLSGGSCGCDTSTESPWLALGAAVILLRRSRRTG